MQCFLLFVYQCVAQFYSPIWSFQISANRPFSGILGGILETDERMAILTNLKAKNMEPGDPALPHGGVEGLTLHPSNKGKGHGKWVLRFTSPITGKRRLAGLGTYPEVSIAEAAKKATAMRSDIAQGVDPLQEKEIQKKREKPPSFAEAAVRVHEELKDGWKNPKHQQQWLNTVNQYAVPLIGLMELKDIQPHHMADVLRPIWLSKPETASRLKQRLHVIMSWGWAHGFCISNPVDVVTHLLPTQPSKTTRTIHHPAMSWKDLPVFWQQSLTTQGYDSSRAILKFIILTACRSGEARGMTWDEVDLENATWTIPAARMKAKMQHRVPLSKEAVQILIKQREMNSHIVFPSVKQKRKLTDMTITMLLRRLKAQSDTEGRTATAHGFRSSFRDWCSENGYPRDLAERALAHTIQNKVEAAYHRTDLLEQRRPMMEKWAAYVCSTTSGSITDLFTKAGITNKKQKTV